jgi:hypothetical protein
MAELRPSNRDPEDFSLADLYALAGRISTMTHAERANTLRNYGTPEVLIPWSLERLAAQYGGPKGGRGVSRPRKRRELTDLDRARVRAAFAHVEGKEGEAAAARESARATVRILLEDRVSQAEIARALGVSRQVLNAMLKRGSGVGHSG